MPTPPEPSLVFYVREAFPSIATRNTLTESVLADGEALIVVSQMDEGVIFGDGIESDRIEFPWGARASVRVTDRRLRLLAGPV